MYAALSQEVSINFVPYGFASVGNFCSSDKLAWDMTYSHWAKNISDNWRWEWRAALWVPTWREGVRWKYCSSETFHHHCNITILCWKYFARFHYYLGGNSDHLDMSSSLQHQHHVLEIYYKISSTPWQKWLLSSKFTSYASLTRFHRY